jgi:hypothetical protein
LGKRVKQEKVLVSKGKKPALIPATPPGWKGTGSLLHDLNAKYGRRALNDPTIRARIRSESSGRVDVKEIDGEWQLIDGDKDRRDRLQTDLTAEASIW